jgi:hypothetical protein
MRDDRAIRSSFRFMRSNATYRRISVLTLSCVLILVAGVIAWGAQYKLSLYDPPGSLSLRIPHAKLLSQKERPVSAAQSLSAIVSSPNLGALTSFPGWPLATALLALMVLDLIRKLIVADRALPPPHFTFLNFFSFRPPPTFLLS